MAQPTVFLPLTDSQKQLLTSKGIALDRVQQTQTGRGVTLTIRKPTRQDRARAVSSDSHNLEGRDS